MRSDWRWWVKLGLVVLASLAAVLLILAGAVRFLDQAEQERARVECVRAQVQAQAQGNAAMAAAVLDAARPQADRAQAFRAWADGQSAVAERIGRC